MRRKWLSILASQRLMFNRSMAQILAWKSNLQREENRHTRRKTLRVRLRSINLSPRADSILGHRGGRRDWWPLRQPDSIPVLILIWSIAAVFLVIPDLILICFINRQLVCLITVQILNYVLCSTFSRYNRISKISSTKKFKPRKRPQKMDKYLVHVNWY